MNKMSLGARMKRYESTYQTRLVDNMYTILRLDGKKFSSYTKGLNKPFDKGLVEDMIETTKYLVNEVQGCKIGYVQSDEITLVLTDFDTHETQGWFDNEIPKILSISASMATAKFNQLRTLRFLKENTFSGSNLPEDIVKLKLANFDSRVFQVGNVDEVYNNLIWRQRDCVKNSIAACAQALYSTSELHGKNDGQQQELVFQKGNQLRDKLVSYGYENLKEENFNWNDVPEHLKRGTSFVKRLMDKEYSKASYEKDQARSKELWFKSFDPWTVRVNQETQEVSYLKFSVQWKQGAIDFAKYDKTIPLDGHVYTPSTDIL